MNHYLSKNTVVGQRERWCLISCSDTSFTERVGDLSELATQVGKAPVTALVDAAEVRVLRVKIPGRSESQVNQAAPYVVEEDLADDVDELNIHVSKVGPDGKRTVTVYELEKLQQVCQTLKASGIRVNRVIPDASLITTMQHQLVAVLVGEQVLYAHNNGLFAAVSSDVFLALVNRLSRDENITEALIVSPDGSNIDPSFGEQIKSGLREGNPNIEITSENTIDSAFKYIVSRHNSSKTSAPPPNLLPQSVEQRTWLGIPPRTSYLLAAGLAAFAILAHVGLLWSNNQTTAAELAQLHLKKQEIFAEAFPEIKRMVNAEVQAQQQLGELKILGPPPAEFLAVLRASTAFFEQEKSQNLKLTGFSFADGVLLLRTESKDMALLEQYRSELSGVMSAEVVNAESGANGINGAIRVKTNR